MAIEGRLDWREWEAKDGGGKRQAVQIIANHVQFLGYKKDEESSESRDRFSPSDAPAESSDFVGAGVGGQEDDIPF